MSDKLDGPLAARVHELEQGLTDGPHRVKVLVHVVGDLAAVQQAGLWTEFTAGDIAIGTIAVEDLNRVAGLDDVASVEAEGETFPELHTSVPEIRADHARELPPGFTGRDVIVGIVDSGIDIFHHAFRKSDGKTRLLSLLDLTLRQTISTTGGPTGGSIQLFWQPPRPPAPPGGGVRPPRPPMENTPVLAFPVTGGQVQTALEAFNAINPGDVAVTGGPLPGTPVAIDFIGRYDSRVIDSGTIDEIQITGTLSGGTAANMVVTRGREFGVGEIDAALQASNPPFLSRNPDGHGTHVAGIAAGDGSQSGNCHGSDYYVGVAPDADLIVVRTTFSSTDNVRGVAYIYDQAATKNRPVVVNMSLGGQKGPHDGTDNSEIALDALLANTAGRALVISAGNDGELYDHKKPELHPQPGGGLHARKTVAPNGNATLGIVIRPGDRADDWFDIWYAGPGQLSFNLRTPDPGGVSLAVTVPAGAGTVTPSPVLANHPIFIRSTLNNLPSGKGRIEFRITPPAGQQVTPGEWTVTLSASAAAEVTFDCWIVLDKIDPHPRFVDLDQDRLRSLTTPGTARNAVTVGAYDPTDSTLAAFSSRGPTTDGRIKPELCAPGVGIVAAKSGARNTGKCCDCCADFYVPDQGTSMSAPHVTGIIALMLQADRTLEHGQITQKLIAGCRPPDPITGPTLPNNDWGAGKVDAEAAVISAKATARGARAPDEETVVLPVAAYAATYLPTYMRVRALEHRVQHSPSGQLIAALISQHADEALRLIESERRVAVAWHRMHGPTLLRLLLSDRESENLLPATLGDIDVARGLARLLDELERAGSAQLRADIATYRRFVLALPGARLDALDRTAKAG